MVSKRPIVNYSGTVKEIAVGDTLPIEIGGVGVDTSNYPTMKPLILFDFGNSKSLDSRITFSRASTGSYYGQDGYLKYAAVDAPRFDHDPDTRESIGLLIERATVNFFTYSQELNQSVWTKTRTTITADAVVSPDSTQTADKIVEDSTASNTHIFERSITYVTGDTFSVSAFLKAGERTVCDFILRLGTSSYAGISVDLSAGTIGAPKTSGLTSALANAEIKRLRDGWYRVGVYGVAAAGNIAGVRISLTDGTTDVYTGNGASGIYAWGLQMADGPLTTSYVQTDVSSQSRALEIVRLSGTNFSTWYRQTEGTFVAKFSNQNTVSGYPRAFTVSDNSTSNYITLLVEESTDSIGGEIVVGGSNISTPTWVSGYTGQVTTAALAYKQGSTNFAQDGVVQTAAASASMPSNLTQIDIGGMHSSGAYLGGHMFRLAYYPVRLTDAQLQAVTNE